MRTCSITLSDVGGRCERAAAAVESRDREQFVSQSHGPQPRAGSRDHLLRPRARPAGPRIHAALLSRGVLSTGRRTTDDGGGGMRNEEEREIKRGTVAHSPDIRRRIRERNKRGNSHFNPHSFKPCGATSALRGYYYPLFTRTASLGTKAVSRSETAASAGREESSRANRSLGSDRRPEDE